LNFENRFLTVDVQIKKRLNEPLFGWIIETLSLGFFLSGDSRLRLFLGGAAVEAHKHGGTQDAFERAVVAGFVNAAFDATHGVACAAEAFKG
jgi:hypothetical protein